MREKLLRDVLRRFEKERGTTPTPASELRGIDLVVYLMLATRHGRDAAERSMKSLRVDFVDWNEVRVTSIPEIALSLRVRNTSARQTRAREIREFLTHLFRERSEVSLDFLDEQDFDKAVAALAALDGIEAGTAAQVLLHRLSAEAPLPISKTAVRVARRIGIVPRDSTPTRTRDGLARLEPSQRHRAYRLLLHLGLTVCGSRNMRCAECAASPECASSKVRPEPQKKPSRPRKAAAKTAGRKVARKKKAGSAPGSRVSSASRSPSRRSAKNGASTSKRGSRPRPARSGKTTSRRKTARRKK